MAGFALSTEGVAKKEVTAPARHAVVWDMVAHGQSQRRALSVGRMSPAALRYAPRPDQNASSPIASSPWPIGIAGTAPG